MNYDTDIPKRGFVTPHWVKHRYSISNSTLYLWISKGQIARPYRVGARAVRFRVEDIRAFEAKFMANNGEVT